MKKHIFIFTAIAALFVCCKTKDLALTFDIPEKGFEVVQHLPKDSPERKNNTLYQAPREITKKEMASPAMQLFIDSLYAVMVRTDGVGIASNQIGKRLQIFIIEALNDNPRYNVLGNVPKQIFINPRITAVSEERMNFWHGCLSAVGEDRGNVATYKWIDYECYNEKGEFVTGRLDGFAAVIFQHEFRHMLNGTYLDHAHHFLNRMELEFKILSGEVPFFSAASDTLPLLIEGYLVGETLEEYHRRLVRVK